MTELERSLAVADCLLNGALTLETAYGRKTRQGLAELILDSADVADPEKDPRFSRLAVHFARLFWQDSDEDLAAAVESMARRAAYYALRHPEVAAAIIMERLAEEEAD